MTFHVGQKVVCVDASSGMGKPWMQCPLAINGVYTILGIRAGEDRKRGPGLSVDGDPGTFWSCLRFRPAVERKTDIEIFTKMLTPTGVDA